MPTITVTRPKTAYRDRARKYKILVDGAPAAELSHGASVDLSVEPGVHAVQAKIDWATTPEVRVDLTTAERASLRVETGGGTALDAFFRPKRYLSLTLEEPGGGLPAAP